MKDILDDMLDPVGGQNDSVTYVCFVMDHSGSMGDNIQKDLTKAQLAKSNFKEQLETLRKETDNIETRISVIEFDDTPSCVIENSELRTLMDTEYHKFKGYWTGGMTALYDSIGMAIDLIKKQLDADNRKDKSALIIVQTDGMENDSNKYKGEEGRKKLKKEIENFENSGLWTFTFLGENIDKEVASSFGIKAGNAMSYDKSVTGYQFANLNTVNGLKAYYDARKVGMTQTDTFYVGDITDKEEKDVN